MATSGLETGRVLLTGCTGEIGSRVAKQLCDLGYQVYGLRGAKNCTVNRPNHSCKKINLLSDSLEFEFSEMLPEILVHTAWLTTPGEFWESNQNKSWINVSKRLINEFVRIGGKYIVVTGSCAEYGWNLREPFHENSLENPASIYGQAKLELLNWLRDQNYSYLWVRTFFQFGMNESKGRLIPSMIDSLIEEKEFVIRSGADIRDFIFIEDAASVLTSLISKKETGLVNLGTGIETKVASLANAIGELFGRSDLIKFESKTDNRSYVVSDPTKLNEIIPSFEWSSLNVALKKTIEARKNDSLTHLFYD